MSKRNLNDISILGRNLKQMRESQHLTLKEYSSFLNYDRNNLSLLEGGIQDIKLSTVVRFAKLLDMDVGVLFSNNFIDDKLTRNKSIFYSGVYVEIFINNVKFCLSQQRKKQADICGDNHEPLSRLLSGHVQDPRISSLSAIATALEVNLSDLLTHNYKEK